MNTGLLGDVGRFVHPISVKNNDIRSLQSGKFDKVKKVYINFMIERLCILLIKHSNDMLIGIQ